MRSFHSFVDLYGTRIEYSRLVGYGQVVDGKYEIFRPASLEKRAKDTPQEDFVGYCNGLLVDHDVPLTDLQQRAVDRTKEFTQKVLLALQGE